MVNMKSSDVFGPSTQQVSRVKAAELRASRQQQQRPLERSSLKGIPRLSMRHNSLATCATNWRKS